MNTDGESGARVGTEVLGSTFAKFWPDLEAKLNEIVDSMSVDGSEAPPERTEREILEELLELTRSQARAAVSFPGFVPSHVSQTVWPSSATTPIITATPSLAYYSPTSPPFTERAGPSTLDPNIAELVDRASEYLGDKAELVTVTEGYLVIQMRGRRPATDEEHSSLEKIAEPYGFKVGYHRP